MFRHVTTRFSGLVILVAGLWGGLIPFVGPYFHFTLGPDKAWTWTTGRLWLVVIPAAASVLGGLILMGGGPRLSGRFGALIALAGGAWFAAGPDVSRVWNHGVTQLGAAHGHHAITRMLEYLTLHTGIGVLITALAAYSLPGAAAWAWRRSRTRDAAIAGTGAAAGAAATRRRDRQAEREVAREEADAGGAGAGARAEAERPGAYADGAAEPAGAPGTGAGTAGAAEAGTRAGTAGAAEAGTGAEALGGHPNDPASPLPPAGAPAAGGTGTMRRRRGGLFTGLRRR